MLGLHGEIKILYEYTFFHKTMSIIFRSTLLIIQNDFETPCLDKVSNLMAWQVKVAYNVLTGLDHTVLPSLSP